MPPKRRKSAEEGTGTPKTTPKRSRQQNKIKDFCKFFLPNLEDFNQFTRSIYI